MIDASTRKYRTKTYVFEASTASLPSVRNLIRLISCDTF